MKGKIVSINISEQKGEKKKPVKEAFINELGIIGDGHSGDWHRQISFLSYESIKSFNQKGSINTSPGDFAENITTSGINLAGLKIGDILAVMDENSNASDGKKVILEVTQIGKECVTPCRIYYQVGSCIMPKEGLFCRVIKTGKIKVGNSIIVERNCKKQVKNERKTKS
ncbi:MAG: MOSC domain-containing protein [Actinobacteria bacterium]|nr:MOSC domain-containing protein [Actinomycetota bacterium]